MSVLLVTENVETVLYWIVEKEEGEERNKIEISKSSSWNQYISTHAWYNQIQELKINNSFVTAAFLHFLSLYPVRAKNFIFMVTDWDWNETEWNIYLNVGYISAKSSVGNYVCVW